MTLGGMALGEMTISPKKSIGDGRKYQRFVQVRVYSLVLDLTLYAMFRLRD